MSELSFLCFIGRQWFNNFMLRKMREYGFYPFTHDTSDDFKWQGNYAEYSETELPVDHDTRPNFILVDNMFFVNRRRFFGHDVMWSFVKRKSQNFSIPVIGIDHSDVILSKFHPKDVDCFDLVLKGQGLPKDRDLMNWEIGVRWGLNRKRKVRRIRFEDQVLSPAQIDKFKLSFDLGAAAYCDVELKRPSSRFEIYDVFFVAAFDSLNRLEGLKICKEHFRTLGWLVKLPDGHPIVGIENWKADPQLGRAEDRELLVRETDRLYRENRSLFMPLRIPYSIYRFLAQLGKTMPAFSGIGELGPRHYQAFEYGKALVCEDVSYIETIFPFQDGQNYVAVEDRLGDLEEKLRYLIENDSVRRRIALQGFSQLQETYRDGNAIFEEYFLRHLGIAPPHHEADRPPSYADAPSQHRTGRADWCRQTSLRAVYRHRDARAVRPLLITALYPPAVGGAATYFGDIALRLARHDGIEQLIVLTEHVPGEPRQSARGKLLLLRYLPTRLSLPQRRWLAHAVTYVLTQVWFTARLPGLVGRHNVDLIHFHTRYRGWLFYAALRHSRVPVIADLRDKMTDPTQLVNVADRLLCCGEGVQHFTIEGGFPSERTVLIPNALVPPAIPPPELIADTRRRHGLGDDPYLLYVGDITHNKGVYDLLKAYQRWRTEHPDTQLVFAGINREGGRFLNQLEGIEGARYLGYLAHQDVLALVRGAEIVVLPSRSEGLPTVILEAVALGTKVICPPGIPEFERHLPQFVLPEVGVDSIVEMLRTVWRCDGLSPYRLSEHSVRRVVEKLVDIYREAVREQVG